MNEFPALTGSESQINWAATIRTTALERIEDEVRTAKASIGRPADALNELVALYREVALRQTEASWWIDSREYLNAPIIHGLLTAEDKARLIAIAKRA